MKNNHDDKQTGLINKAKTKPYRKKQSSKKSGKSLEKILEENTKLKEEIERLKNEKKSCGTSTIKTKPKNKKCKLSITDEEKYSLALEIGKLNSVDKLGLKTVLKNHMVVTKPGEINFSLDKLPALIFKDLQQYVSNCLKNNNTVTKTISTVEPIEPPKQLESNENITQLINIKRSKCVFDEDDDMSESLSSKIYLI